MRANPRHEYIGHICDNQDRKAILYKPTMLIVHVDAHGAGPGNQASHVEFYTDTLFCHCKRVEHRIAGRAALCSLGYNKAIRSKPSCSHCLCNIYDAGTKIPIFPIGSSFDCIVSTSNSRSLNGLVKNCMLNFVVIIMIAYYGSYLIGWDCFKVSWLVPWPSSITFFILRDHASQTCHLHQTSIQAILEYH